MKNDPLLEKLKDLEKKYEYQPYHPRDWTPEQVQQLIEQDEQDAFDNGEL